MSSTPETSVKSQNMSLDARLKPSRTKLDRLFEENKIIKTNQFGLVLTKDYENPRFSFLKRDKGIPYKKINPKGDIKIASEYWEYRSLLKRRASANSYEQDAEDSIVNDTPDNIPF